MTTAVAAGLHTELRGFWEVQRLAYECAEAVAARLTPGVTEREAARMRREWLRERGMRDWLHFHLPIAWFGDRTAFTDFRVPPQFFPTGRRLEPGMPFILDMAHVYRGFTADIGYSGPLGHNPVQRRPPADLEAHRELVLGRVRERGPLREIYEDVARLVVRRGYANRHRAHPFGVIAHKVDRVRERRLSRRLFGFGTQSLKGLWAVESHPRFRGTGAKFEEILMVTDSADPEESASWLDDELPWGSPRARSVERGGVRRWAEEK